MRYLSTRNSQHLVSMKEAVLSGLAPDGGLYMPQMVPRLPSPVAKNLGMLSLQEAALEIFRLFVSEEEIPQGTQREIIEESMTFPAPLQVLEDSLAVLELFHGPSLAFKDFGARFMARTMSWFIRHDTTPLHILVATSGDTGGAVALGFYNVPGIEVTILYPKGRVSELQERQLTTHGGNIRALEVEGSFDDCQRLVKEAFCDEELKSCMRLSSANSINIARLIPQTFYYMNALSQIARLHPLNSEVDKESGIVFSVPSGNFGNLFAGLLAKRMGAPIHRFIAATNINKVIPEYLESGVFQPRESLQTISNAMDVGNPSNFERIQSLFSQRHDEIARELHGYFADDVSTRRGILRCWKEYGYIADPHGAVGYLAAQEYLKKNRGAFVVFLETAHPIKFQDTVEEVIEGHIPRPAQIGSLFEKEVKKRAISPNLPALKNALLDE